MNQVPIDLSRESGAKVIINNLVSSPSLSDLDQDLVLVELPGDISIDVSWYPENTIPGMYHITVVQKNQWDSPIVVAQTETAEYAATLVQLIAERKSKQQEQS